MKKIIFTLIFAATIGGFSRPVAAFCDTEESRMDWAFQKYEDTKGSWLENWFWARVAMDYGMAYSTCMGYVNR